MVKMSLTSAELAARNILKMWAVTVPSLPQIPSSKPLFCRYAIETARRPQPCRLAEIPIVLVFNESGELLNTFVVSVQKRSVIDLNLSL